MASEKGGGSRENRWPRKRPWVRGKLPFLTSFKLSTNIYKAPPRAIPVVITLLILFGIVEIFSIFA